MSTQSPARHSARPIDLSAARFAYGLGQQQDASKDRKRRSEPGGDERNALGDLFGEKVLNVLDVAEDDAEHPAKLNYSFIAMPLPS
jgi:hypothetical protein